LGIHIRCGAGDLQGCGQLQFGKVVPDHEHVLDIGEHFALLQPLQPLLYILYRHEIDVGVVVGNPVEYRVVLHHRDALAVQLAHITNVGDISLGHHDDGNLHVWLGEGPEEFPFGCRGHRRRQIDFPRLQLLERFLPVQARHRNKLYPEALLQQL